MREGPVVDTNAGAGAGGARTAVSAGARGAVLLLPLPPPMRGAFRPVSMEIIIFAHDN